MKKLIISIAAALFAVVSVLAGTQTIDGRDWTYTVSGGEATIIYVEGTLTGEVVVPSTLGGSPVTVVGMGVFEGCNRMRSVSLPDGLKKIGAYAFQNCTSLTGVTIPGGVTEVGEGAFADCKGLKSVTIPQCVCDDGLWFAFDADNLTKVVIAEGATAIGDFAFEGCYNLTLVTIPGTVQFIGESAFEACYALKRVAIPEGVEEIGAAAFMDCFDLESVTLPSSVTTIGECAFAGCISLTGMTLPAGLISIGASAFEDCCGLSRLTLPNQLEQIGSGAFRNSGLTSASIPNSVTNVGAGAFASCAALSTVTITQKILDLGVRNVFDTNLAAAIVIADGVRQIPSSAFEGFKKITSVTFPVSMEEIYDRAFFGCESLTRIDFPEVVSDPHGGGYNIGVFYIGSQAFEGCCSLTSLTIPEVAEGYGYSFYANSRAFANCYGLKNITCPGEIFWLDGRFDLDDPQRCRGWETVTVQGWLEEVPVCAFKYQRELRNVVLPASVRTIGDYAFEGCAKLESVTIEGGSAWDGDLWEYYNGGIRAVGTGAFRDCASLVRVDIPEGVTQIGDSAFAGCAKLAAVTLPESVQAIGSSAFRDCRSLASVNFPSAVTLPGYGDQLYGGVRSIGNRAFYGCSSLAVADLPACLEQIGGQAFWVCYALTDVTLPKCVFDCRCTYEFYDTSTWDWRTETLYGLDAVFGSRDDGEHPCRWERVTVLNNDWGDEPSFDKVPSNAFSGLQNLRTVTLPTSVRSIEDFAFQGCTKLECVTIEGGSAWDGELSEYYQDGSSRVVGTDAFAGCVSLTRVDIPDGVTQIAGNAFSGCAKLASVELPESVQAIGSSAFRSCRSLASVNFPDAVTLPMMGDQLYGGVRSIGSFAFEGCTSLAMANLPACLEEIGDRAFANSYSLKDVSLPWCVFEEKRWRDNVMSRNGLQYVFELDNPDRPRQWENVTVGYGVETVVGFGWCPNLRTVTLPPTVRYIGSGAFYGCAKLESVTISDEVDWENSEPSGEGSVGSSAFEGCASLVRVDIPTCVNEIYDRAFYGCRSLVDVTLPEAAMDANGTILRYGVRSIGECAFIGCSSLASINFPERLWNSANDCWFEETGLRGIGSQAFANCTSLTVADIPDCVEQIGERAFANCYALKDVTLPYAVFEDPEGSASSLRSMFALDNGERPRQWENVTVGYGVQSVNGFGNCPNLRTVTLPVTVRYIGSGAFYGCAKLESVTISDEVDWENSELSGEGSVGDSAFEGCVSLVRVDIPDCVTEIGSRAFYGCRSLTDVTLPEAEANGYGMLIHGVRSIGEQAFFGCSSLASVNFPEELWDTANGCWNEETGLCEIGAQAFESCTGLTVLEIPDSVEEIGDRAFANCYALKDVTLPGWILEYSYEKRDRWGSTWSVDGLQGFFEFDNPDRPRQWENVTVGYGAETVDGFGWCPNLETVTLPASVRSIECEAFKNCSKLESVTISDEVDWWRPDHYEAGWIGQEAFRGCVNLKHVDIPRYVESIGFFAFEGCRSLRSVALPEAEVSSSGQVLTLGVTSIEDCAFRGCVSLLTVNMPDIKWNTAYGEWIPESGVQWIGSSAFENCTSLTVAYIPFDHIGSRVFANCYSLRDVTMPASAMHNDVFERDTWERPCQWENVTIYGYGLTSVGGFAGCPNLRTVTLPAGVRVIESDAFRDCAMLERVTISDEVYWEDYYRNDDEGRIDSHAFDGCVNLTHVDFPENLTSIGNEAFRNCYSLVDVTLPESVMRIENEAFWGCGVTDVRIPDSVTQIGESVFWDCVALKNVTLPKRVEEVGLWNVFGFSDTERPCPWEAVTLLDGWTSVSNNLFAGLQSLKSVALPASVRTIGEGAFSGCVGLRDVTFGGNAPSAIGVGAFSGISSNCTAWVKKGSTGWGAEIAGRWQGMKIDYLPSSLYLPSLSYGANVVATQTDRGWTVVSATGSVLTRTVLTSLKVNVTLPDGTEVETTKGYEKALSSDGKSVELCLKTPQIAVTAQERAAEIDEDDPSKMLVDVPESWLATKPEPNPGESVSALPVKAVKGLWYQVSWGDGLQNMTQGEKVQATSEYLYLGVIKQTGASGFYRLSVSEK